MTAPLPFEMISAPPLPTVFATYPDAHDSSITAVAVVEHEGAPLVDTPASRGR